MDTLELPHRGNSHVYLQHMLQKIRKAILKFTFIPRIMSLVFASFKHLKLPISIKMPVTVNCLCLQHSYSSKFEFTSNFFANLVIAWL